VSRRRPSTKNDRSVDHSVDAVAESRRRYHFGRGELTCLLCLVACGIGLRCAFLSRAAVEHFDEGVYASNLWFGAESSYRYPQRHLYAPPLLPGLIEATLIAERSFAAAASPPCNWSPLLPSLIAACLTPLAIWWVARHWFGRSVGLAAAALAACSDFHALYSRAALTDCLLTLFLVLSLWLLERALRSGSWQSIIGAGCTTGLAWWTKYNGWLPLALGGGGALVDLITSSSGGVPWRKRIARWGGAAVIAFLCWCPFLISLQSAGGYSAVATNHRRYVVGVRGWFESAARQHANLRFFDGAVTLAGLTVVTAALALRQRRNAPLQPPARSWPTVAACATVPPAIATLVGTDAVFLAWGAAGIAREFWRSPPAGQPTNDRAGSAGGAFLAVWFFGLLVLTPLYHAYPRLVLPWLASAWLGAALGLRDWARFCLTVVSVKARSDRTVLLSAAGVTILALALLLSQGQNMADKGVPAWRDRTGMQGIAAEIIAAVESWAARTGNSLSDIVLCVYGEPALFYHLQARGFPQAVPVARIPDVSPSDAGPSGTALLVAGPHAERTLDFRQHWEVAQADYEPLLVSSYRPSPLVLLDNYDPRRELRAASPPKERIALYVPRRLRANVSADGQRP